MIETDQDKWAAKPKTITRFESFTEVFFLSIRWSIASVYTQIYYVRSSIRIGTQHISWHTCTQHVRYCSGGSYTRAHTTMQIMWPRFSLDLFLSFGHLIVGLLSQRLLSCVVSCCNLTYIRTSTVYSNECRVWSREPLLFVYVLFVIKRDTYGETVHYFVAVAFLALFYFVQFKIVIRFVFVFQTLESNGVFLRWFYLHVIIICIVMCVYACCPLTKRLKQFENWVYSIVIHQRCEFQDTPNAYVYTTHIECIKHA